MGWRSSSTFLAMPILALTAALLLAPSLALGTLPTHSSPYSLSWSAQFSEQFRAGHLYPRWLSHSFSGLGAPTFYFYPPLSFWIDALVSAASFNSLSVSYRLSVTSFLALWASGIAMYAWLRHETSRETAALVGAIAFMAAPYHLFDHYIRGAFAEFTAYAVVPMVMLTLRLCAERRRNGPVLLALAYAALLMTHLPTAALMTVTLMPAYLLFRSCRLGLWGGALDLIARVAFGVMLGIGLAAIYIVPALTLQQWVSTDILWAPQHRPDSWLLLSPERWVAPSLMRIVGSLSMSAALLAVGICIALPLAPPDKGRRYELGFWAIATLTVVALMAGLFPWFWSLPGVKDVQFPWRLLSMIEFSVITGLCLSRIRELKQGLDYELGAVAIAMGAGAAVWLLSIAPALTHDAVGRIAITLNDAPLRQFEAAEYLPRGYGSRAGGLPDYENDPLPGVPTISCEPAAIVCRAKELPFGELMIEIESQAATTAVLRRFSFPTWRIEPALPISATADQKLVSFIAPPGRIAARLIRTSTAEEWWGAMISGVSLILLSATAMHTALRSRSSAYR